MEEEGPQAKRMYCDPKCYQEGFSQEVLAGCFAASSHILNESHNQETPVSLLCQTQSLSLIPSPTTESQLP